MKKLAQTIFYERHLPHIQPPGATLFVTYRLVGSIPVAMLNELRILKEQINGRLAGIGNEGKRERQAYQEQRRLFGKWDSALDNATSGPKWLIQPEIAKEVTESLHFLDGKVFDLDTCCVMSNHAHILITPLLDKDLEEYFSLSSIMHSHKRYTARQANKILKREGQFWQHESYDHYVRDEAELERIRRYIINNPVSAGLVEEWEEWPWTYCKWF